MFRVWRHGEELWDRKLSSQHQGVEPSQKGLSMTNPVGQSQEAASSGSRIKMNAPPFPSQNTTSLYVTANKTVFLQTALTTVHNPNQPTIFQDAHAVLYLES